MNRRDLIKSLIGTVASYSLLETVFRQDAFAEAVRPITDSWVKEVNAMSRDLKAVIVLDLQGKPADVNNIDPYGAEKLSGGRLRARKLSVDEALHKYGHDTHHGDLPRAS